jgi:hypothetical protein
MDAKPHPPPYLRNCEKIGSGPFLVIPSKAGIQCFRSFMNFLDPGFHRGDGVNIIFSQIFPFEREGQSLPRTRYGGGGELNLSGIC